MPAACDVASHLPLKIHFGSCICLFRATEPELHYTVYDYQLSAADKDGGHLLKANQV